MSNTPLRNGEPNYQSIPTDPEAVAAASDNQAAKVRYVFHTRSLRKAQ